MRSNTQCASPAVEIRGLLKVTKKKYIGAAHASRSSPPPSLPPSLPLSERTSACEHCRWSRIQTLATRICWWAAGEGGTVVPLVGYGREGGREGGREEGREGGKELRGGGREDAGEREEGREVGWEGGRRKRTSRGG